jgi:hypothetical protein
MRRSKTVSYRSAMVLLCAVELSAMVCRNDASQYPSRVTPEL